MYVVCNFYNFIESEFTKFPQRLMEIQNKNFGEEHMDNQEDLMPGL